MRKISLSQLACQVALAVVVVGLLVVIITSLNTTAPFAQKGLQATTAITTAIDATAVYGDGSQGALNVTNNLDLSVPQSDYNFQFSSLNIAASGILVVPSGTILRVNGNCTINGTIVVSTGAQPNGAGTASPGVANAIPASPYAGLGLNVTQAAQVNYAVFGGGSGARAANNSGAGSAGGGSVTILCNGTFVVGATGGIHADGQAGQIVAANAGGSGGGAGGVILIAAKNGVTVSGTLTARGGAGGNGSVTAGRAFGGGGGGGGIIHYYAPSVSTSGTVLVGGGSAGVTANAGVGPIYSSYGGGACGGNGGSGDDSVIHASGGATGYILTSTTTNPENFFL